ncbi:S66 peptidase family protein [Sunxiuqinia indica]|uniref:S66 peptidase family protein n=1 Tax=Sunxiuqinia indica TaxID=2692584 RepID=UPI00135B3C81|nr:LD-carboxypeptidase [Sunxiuqinia indica]
MQKPDFLQSGDRIRIVSPSGKVQKDKIVPGINLLQKQGFEVLVAPHTFSNHFQFAAKDEERLNDLQLAFDDPDCKAIICARGGYGAIRIADKLNLSNFQKQPKWLVGFSDITVLHALFQKEGFCSIHGAMPAFFLKENQPSESFTELINVLKGKSSDVLVPPHEFNRNGNTSAQVIGGNLSIVYSLLGTPLEPQTDGKILFIEDLAEYLYHLDRIMHSLKLSGKLAKLRGLLVGGFTDMKNNDSPFGQTALEIIRDAVKDYNYPVCFDFPAGHIARNLPLVFGADYILTVTEEKAQLSRS